MHVCTIIAKNYVAYARVLARSFAEHHPDEQMSVLVIDDAEGFIDPAQEPFELLTPAEIACDEFELMAARYNVLELSTAVKPWLLAHLLARGSDPVTYLDPDIRVFDSLERLEQLARAHGIVLIPHNTVPIPSDGERPTQVDIMIAGVFNLGYITLAGGAQTDRLLDWWSERLRRDCRVDPIYGYFVDQRWMDLIPGLASDYAVVRDPELNVAYWNLHGRDLQHDGERYTVDGHPLAFFHFSGFDPDQPTVLSRHQTRVRMSERPALARLCREYAAALEIDGHAVARRWPYSHGTLPDGTAFGTPLRRLFCEGEDRGDLHASPLAPAGCEAFLDWLAEEPEGAPAGLTRLLAGLHNQRADLQTAFPDITGADLTPYLNWARERGVVELGLPRRLAPAAASRRTAAASQSPRSAPTVIESPLAANVVGCFGSEGRMGEAARQVVSALDTVGIPVLPLSGEAMPGGRQSRPFAHLDHDAAGYPLNVICMNADALSKFAQRAGEKFFAGRYSIGLWFGEVSSAPSGGWKEQFAVLDEVWAPSRQVVSALSAVSPVPVVPIVLPIEIPDTTALPRHALEIPQEAFVFLCSFDYSTGFERKNPLGVVAAFRAAFEPGSGASLVIKSINAESDPSNRARLLEAIADRADIRLLERYLPPPAKNSMLAACDCYVSLHRAQAFGLTIAEAMYLGKPVIATGYSGNVDFMNDLNSYVVDWQPVAVGSRGTPDPAGGEWAQPNVDHAAALMREVFDHREEAQERGRHAAADIRSSHSLQAAGGQMRSRLKRAHAQAIGERRPEFIVELPTAATIARRVEQAPDAARAGRLPREVLRRAVLRVLKPFTAYQFAVNAQILRQLDALARYERDAQSDRLRQARSAAQINDAVVDRLQRWETETHAIPYMDGAPFATTRDPLAGVVLGYGDANGAGEGNEYRAFEDVFRGPEGFIRDRQRRYLPIIGRREPVLDVGCGRGELLDLLREAGIAYVGVDSDAGMVARCREKGHREVVHGDGLEYLKQAGDASIGVIFAAQVIEHLSHDQLLELLGLARRTLAPDGLLIAETVNPHSPAALKTFWVDLTHQRPIFPEVALELAREAGFGSAYVFHPNGTGDVERDRFVQGEFALVARAGASVPAVRS